MQRATKEEPSEVFPMSWAIEEVAAATNGTLLLPEERNVQFTSVAIDSRRVLPGALFVALHGETYDGHDFLDEAFARGAAGALVHRDTSSARACGLIRVTDTLKALGDLAAWHRARFDVKIVAITGSNGKTTTKEMIASTCAAAAWQTPRNRVLKNEGNLNNLIGLPLTLLRLVGEEAVGVLEMGMNRPGEIARLTEIARPDFGVVLNVGRAHLQGVGGIAGVAAAKGELFAGLAAGATIAVNADDPWVCKIAAPFTGRKVYYGQGAEIRAENIADFGVDGVGFDLVIGNQRAKVRLRLVGRHNVSNALATAAVAHAMGLSLDVIMAGLRDVVGVPMRMQVERSANGVVIINDSYNANPSSVDVALEAVRRFSGRRVVVLGEMRELGDEGRRAHREIGERVATLDVDLLVTLGELGEAIAEGARSAGMPESAIRVCRSHQDAALNVTGYWRPGDVVLVKGSRALKMEEVVRLLHATAGSP
jgi:UDP-N-acetylmuramoyl-tripeptide--D-alanyl-D-alanine ligase